jgi:hypothetical protein
MRAVGTKNTRFTEKMCSDCTHRRRSARLSLASSSCFDTDGHQLAIPDMTIKGKLPGLDSSDLRKVRLEVEKLIKPGQGHAPVDGEHG